MRDIQIALHVTFAASTHTPGVEESNHSTAEATPQAQPTTSGVTETDVTQTGAPLPHNAEPEGVSTFKLMTGGDEKPTLVADLATALGDSFEAATANHDGQSSEHVNQDSSESILPGTHV